MGFTVRCEIRNGNFALYNFSIGTLDPVVVSILANVAISILL